MNISAAAAIRIKNDLNNMYKDPVPGIMVVPSTKDISEIHALITGPCDTPYEGGFFHFVVEFPSDYPLKPPRVQFKTTGFGTSRLHPNLYRDGNVCLSILGTFVGPQWSPAQNLSSVLISIQSLLNDKPYFNSPHVSKEIYPGISDAYNKCVQHETIRCAVCEMMEFDNNLSEDFKAIIESSFPDYFDFYINICNQLLNLDGQNMVNPFESEIRVFQFLDLRTRLERLKEKMDRKYSGEDM